MIKVVVLVFFGMIALLVVGNGVLHVLGGIVGAIVGVAVGLAGALIGVLAGLFGAVVGLCSVLAVAAVPLAIIGLAVYGLVKLIQAV